MITTMKMNKLFNIDAKRLPLIDRFLLLEDLNKDTPKNTTDEGFDE